MFGFGTTNTANQEAEAQAVERAKQVCRDQIKHMHDATPEDAERHHKWLKDYCGAEKRLPFEFRKKALARARQLECEANMRRADSLLHWAAKLSAEEHMKERARALGEAQRYLGKANMLGADEDFRHAAQRLIETIWLTGGVQHQGPTRAKPRDLAPKAPNRAKGDA